MRPEREGPRPHRRYPFGAPPKARLPYPHTPPPFGAGIYASFGRSQVFRNEQGADRETSGAERGGPRGARLAYAPGGHVPAGDPERARGRPRRGEWAVPLGRRDAIRRGRNARGAQPAPAP